MLNEFTDRNEIDIKIVDSAKNRIIVYFAVFATACMIVTSLYLAFTPVASDTVGGCQPRYLVPMVFPVLLFAGTGRIRNQICPAIYNLLVGATSTYFLLAAIWKCCISQYTFY